jgi:hypothetical protein
MALEFSGWKALVATVAVVVPWLVGSFEITSWLVQLLS